MQISGKTRLIPIIGHPVAQVKSPSPINAWCIAAGLDMAMVPFDIPPDRLAAFFDLIRVSGTIVGLSITYPHKQPTLALVDDVSPRCRRVGAVNTVRRDLDGRLIGDMTDGLAMRHAIERSGGSLSGQSALLVGAGGGAGAAIADALCEGGIARLILCERSEDRRAQVMRSLRNAFPEIDLVLDDGTAEFHIGINASPLGMRPEDPLPFDLRRVCSGGVVADAVTPFKTSPLVATALAQGYATVTGADMAKAQLPFQCRHWGIADDL